MWTKISYLCVVLHLFMLLHFYMLICFIILPFDLPYCSKTINSVTGCFERVRHLESYKRNVVSHWTIKMAKFQWTLDSARVPNSQLRKLVKQICLLFRSPHSGPSRGPRFPLKYMQDMVCPSFNECVPCTLMRWRQNRTSTLGLIHVLVTLGSYKFHCR